MKKTLRFLLGSVLCFLSITAQAQTVTIPANNSSSGSARFPFSSWWGYEFSHSYYSRREVGLAGGTIYNLSWFLTGSATVGTAPVEIRLLATPDSVATNTTYTDAGSTVVYNGTMNAAMFAGSNRWVNFPLTTPFVLPAGSSLLVVVKTSQAGSGNEASNAKQFAFHSTTQNRAATWAEDNAIPITGTLSANRPNIRIGFTMPMAIDAAVESINSPTNICGPTTPISITVGNNGSTATGVFSAFYSFNDGTPVSVSVPTLASNSSTTVNFPVQTLSGNGPFKFKFWTSLAGDLLASNDTLTRVLSRPVSFVPVSFDGFNGNNLSDVFPAWSEAQGAFAPTGSTSSWEASSSINFGSTGANLFMSGTTSRNWLVGPAFIAAANSGLRFRVSKSDFSGGANTALLQDDSLKVMVSTNCGTSWMRAGAVTASNSLTNIYQTVSFPLMATAGQEMRVALQATSGSISNTTSYYLNVDDISLVSLGNADIGPLAITSPVISCGLSTTNTISARFFNFGTQVQTDVPVFYSVNNQAAVAGILPSIGINTFADFTFNIPANLTISNQINLRVWSALTTDISLSNDTIRRTYNRPSTLAPVSFTGFTGSNLADITNNEWQEHSGNTLSSIVSGSSNWNSTFTSMTTALGSIGATINLFFNNRREWLVSNSFIIQPSSGFRFRAAVSNFSGGVFAAGMGSDDSLKVMVTTNCGTSWQEVSSLRATSGLTNQYQTFTVPLGSYAGQEIRIGLKATDGSVDDPQDYYLNVDDLQVVVLPPVDLVLEALTSPSASACGLSATAPISIRIRNMGTAPASGFSVSYRINNGTVVSENITASIASNAILNYTFIAPANLSTVGSYNFTVWASHPNDPTRSNDTLKNQMVNNIILVNTFPYFESFETSAGSWVAGGQGSSWALGVPAKPSLTVAGHGTRSWLTGGLSGNYADNEASFVTSPCFNFSGLTRPWIEMRVWWKTEASWDGMALQYTTNNGQTWVLAGDLNTGENWYNDATIGGLNALEPSEKGWTGSSPTSIPPQSGGWITARHLLTALAGQSQVRFRVVFGTDVSGILEGVGFDAIRIYDSPSKDLTMASIISPSTCGISDSMRVRVNVRNEGTAKQGGFSVSYQVGSQPIQTAVFADSLNAGQTRALALPLHPTQLAPGTYTLRTWVTLAGDQNLSNDTIKNYSFVSVLDVLANVNFTSYDGNNISTVFPGWREGAGIGAPIGTTSGWNTSNSSQTAFYGSATAKVNLYAAFMKAWLISNSFKVSPNNILEYDLGFTRYNDTIVHPDGFLGSDDQLQVMISTNCGSSWTPIHTINKDSLLSVRMKRKRVSLSAYSGQIVQIAFFASDGSVDDAPDTDVHIDNVRTLRLEANDVGVMAVISPSSNCGLNLPQTLTVRVNNFGFSAQSSIPIWYSINGAAPVSHTVAGPLAPSGQITVSFPLPINLNMAGNYTIKVWTNLSGDLIVANDTARHSITRFSATTPSVNFNGYTGANISTSAPFWQEATGLSTPVNGNSAWTNAALGSNTVARISLTGGTPRAWIVSPAIKVFGQPQLVFKAALRTLSGTVVGAFGIDDSVSVMVSTNCGSSWASVSVFKAGTTGTPALSANLAEYTLNLPLVYANSEILVGFRASDGTATAPGADFLLDDIQVRNNTSTDIGVSAIMPLSFVRGSSTNLSVRVTNYGTIASPNTAIATRYGTTSYTTPIPAIAAGQSINVSPGTLNPFQVGTFSAEAYTLLSTDEDRGNDTLTASYTVIESTSSAKANLASGFYIYPNPGKTRFSIGVADDLKPVNAEIIVRDLSGKIVFKTNKLVGGLMTTNLELEGLPAGTYLVSLTCTNAHWNTKLVISK